MTEEERALLQLHLASGATGSNLETLYQAFGSWRAAVIATPSERIHAGCRAKTAATVPAENDPRFTRALRALDRLEVRILTRYDAAYPASFRNLHCPPFVLYLRGTLPEERNALAVVGARKSSPASLNHLFALCRELGRHDRSIISGLARGADTAAHRGALQGGGTTVAVLGCGIDRPYPQENLTLLEAMVEKGAVLTEYAPGTPPLPYHFPARNRLVSALAKGVLVSEAAAKSGSLITADFALEQGKEVFVVPGAPYAPQCEGSNDLLKQGAHPVTAAIDILEILWPGQPTRKQQIEAEKAVAQLPDQSQQMLSLIDTTPCHIDEITRLSGLTPQKVSATLLDLELAGCVEALPGKFYLKRL